jgi:hypothetical protein
MSTVMSKSPVHISTMSGKLEGFKSISTNTMTNNFCIKMNGKAKSTICASCYSMSMLKGYRKNTAPALQRNSDLLSSRVLKTDELPHIVDEYFRFSSHGELINSKHLRNLIKIAEHNPHTTFALWTKRRDLISQYAKRWPMPTNLILVYSNPKVDAVMDTPPRFFDRVFNNVTDEYKGEANCTGQKCKDCLLCYKWHTTDVIVEHVK